jgi:ABC-type transport system substrate-binding protein
VGTTPDGQPSPNGGIATKWEHSPDYRRWTFQLRKGVKFHNGDDLTSEDVKFSLQRAMGKRSTTGYAGILRSMVQDIETPAPDRVVIVTKEPALIVPNYLSRSLSTEGMVLPKKYIEANGDDVFARKPVGSGPYRFVEQVTGSHVKLAAVDNHWRIGTPKYKNVTFRLVPEETTRIALLRRGEVDIAELSRERVKELEGEGFPFLPARGSCPHDVVDPRPGRDGGPDERQAACARPPTWPSTAPRSPRPSSRARPTRPPSRSDCHGPSATSASGDAGDVHPLRSVRAKKLLAVPVRPEVPARRLRVSAPRPAGGQSLRRGGRGLLGKDRHQDQAHPRGLSRVPQELGGPEDAGLGGLNTISPTATGSGTFALLEKQAYTPSKPTDTVNDPEVEAAMMAQVMRQTDKDKAGALMRNIYLRIRSEHLGVPVVYLHSAYATSKTLPKWTVGTVMYDLFIDQLAASK